MAREAGIELHQQVVVLVEEVAVVGEYCFVCMLLCVFGVSYRYVGDLYYCLWGII